MKDQTQKGGNSSTNIQASGDVIIKQGFTVAEARQIALDVFRANYLSLSDEAADVARKRAEEITEKFLKKLQEQNADGITQAKEPDFQHAIFTVQKEFARCGDAELGDLLVDLLVDRTKQASRSILQIVLNESLGVAPKLTLDQLAALSLIFLFRYTINDDIYNHDSFHSYLDRYVLPFCGHIHKKNACFQHLAYSGCGTVGFGDVDLVRIFQNNYAGLFSKGFDETQFRAKEILIPLTHSIFVRCLNDINKWQINAINEDDIKKKCLMHQIGSDEVLKLLSLQKKFLMKSEQIKQLIIKGRAYMENVFDVWNGSYMHRFTLTSVGIAIGHANIKKNLGEFTDLSTWIN